MPVRRSGRETGAKKLYLKLVSTDAKWEELEIEPLWPSCGKLGLNKNSGSDTKYCGFRKQNIKKLCYKSDFLYKTL